MSIPIGYLDSTTNTWKKIGDVPIPPPATVTPPTPTPEPTPPPTPTPPTPTTPTKDKWGIKMLNPTKTGGREWFLNETNWDDKQFYRKSGTIEKLANGYSCSGAVRLYVKSPEPFPLWSDVEITGYYYISVGVSGRNAIQHYAKGGIHTNSSYTFADGKVRLGNPLGTKMSARIYSNSDVLCAKEIGHSVYAQYRGAKSSIVPSLVGPRRWFGWKGIFQTFLKNGKPCTKIEGWLDDDSDPKAPKNNWKLVTSAIDEPTNPWNTYDAAEFDALIKQGALEGTGLTAAQYKDMVITWPGHPLWTKDKNQRPIASCASFRWDDLTVIFRCLSAREIGQGPAVS